jgi:hypothetical protein
VAVTQPKKKLNILIHMPKAMIARCVETRLNSKARVLAIAGADKPQIFLK